MAVAAIGFFASPGGAEHRSAEVLDQLPPEAREFLTSQMLDQINGIGHSGSGGASGLAGPGDGGAFAAAEQANIERIHTYDVRLQVEADGSLAVREVIAYDFGSVSRHGIFREIPVRLPYDDQFERVYEIDEIAVTTDTDASDAIDVTDESGIKKIRIGDPDETITGRHTYTVSYRVKGSLNGFPDHDELYWNAIGQYWPVPIGAATVSVTVPATVGQVACFAGPATSQLPCQAATSDGPAATFRQAPMGAFQAFTVVVGFPTGAVPSPKPILDEKWTPAKAFSTSPGHLAGTGGLFAILIGGISALAWQQGRDRRYIGSAVDATFGNEGGQDESVPLFGGDETPVEFAPPDNLRPGQIGTLIDETAHPLDVTATIVDLAVRGYMRIEEIEKEGLFGKADWRMVKLKEAGPELLHYEAMLFGDLFDGGDEVLLSGLKNTFATEMRKVQNALYDDALKQGWFGSRPDKVRGKWIGVGIGVLLLGLAVTAAAAALSTFGLLGVPVVVAGILLLVLSNDMPSRTAAGTGVLRRTLGFRRFIEESEKERARFAERAHLFTEYLPYAIVFGATEKWAKAFAGLDGQLPDTGGWYVGSRPGFFHAAAFSSSMDNFSSSSVGTLTSTPGSSGSSGMGGGGFSGGGGGGGGGGSW